MLANSSPMSVADYCSDFNNGKIRVNEEYQRKVGLWTTQARSYFIESIILGFPVPKLYLHARLDLKSRQTIKEVVDGQQRTNALQLFYNGKFRLTKNIETEDLRGKNYTSLPDEYQSAFLSYSLPIDQFSGASDAEIREAFRRMNANNIPLNDEEQRNAQYQGEFKWFITSIADAYESRMASIGLFSKRDLIRMADFKFYSEVVLHMDGGFVTVKAKQIDNLYKKYNASFPCLDRYNLTLRDALDRFLELDISTMTSLRKTHVAQSLVAALSEISAPGIVSDHLTVDQAQRVRLVEQESVPIEILDAAIREPERYPQLTEFIDASTRKTNVAEAKLTRFAYFLAALRG